MKSNSNLVSIVIPCFNHEKYVEETIKSIVNQSYKNIELIVIDDGSNDNSAQIISKLSSQYNFIFVHRPNKGLSATLNEGIKLSSGKYWCVCASDDILKLDKIEKQVNFMEQNIQYGMCYGKVILFDGNGNESRLEINHSQSGWIFEDLIIGKFWIPAMTCMIKKEILNDIGLFDEELWVEDWDMWVRIANKHQIGFIDDYLAYYRQHDTNISKQGWKMYESKVASLAKWKDLDNYNKIIEIWKLKWFRELSRDYKKEAKKYLPCALRKIYKANSFIGLIKYIFVKNNNG